MEIRFRGKLLTLHQTLAKLIRPMICAPVLDFRDCKNLQNFVKNGGLLITANDTSEFAVETNISHGVTIQPARAMRLPGTILRSKMVDNTSPIAYGYGDDLAIFGASSPIFNINNSTSGGRGRRGSGGERATGRGTADDLDTVQNRPPDEIPDNSRVATWEAGQVTDDQLRNNPYLISLVIFTASCFALGG